MFTIRRILMPMDWSQPALSAFELAASMAKRYGANLDVLYVVPLPAVMYGPPPTDWIEHLRAELQRFSVDDSKCRVAHLVREGEPAATILDAAKQLQSDLIVIGTHGRRGMSRFLDGSVAEEVARQAPCPVLAVNGNVRLDHSQLAGT